MINYLNMTSRNLYDGVLIELHKENAPNLLLEDFNYFANKAVNQYINKRYNIYDVNQQTTDDLRVLKATALLTPHKVEDTYDGLSLVDNGMATYYVDLPGDYLHLLNCICIYNVKKTYKCYNAGDTWRAPATRLTADMYSQVLDNFWTKPTYKRPYYYIHNINTSETVPTNPYNNGEGTDRIINYHAVTDKVFNHDILGIVNSDSSTLERDSYYLFLSSGSQPDKILHTHYSSGTASDQLDVPTELKDYIFKIKSGQEYIYQNNKWVLNSIYPTYSEEDRSGNIIINDSDKDMFSSINIAGNKISNIERASQVRYGNASRVRLEIRYGTDNSVFTLDEIPGKKGGKVYIDYIKSPQHIRLTQEEIDYTEDKSQVLEFPDYVCQEILNELVHLVMENISDLRLQTHPIVSLSIANPTQQLAPEAAGQSAQ